MIVSTESKTKLLQECGAIVAGDGAAFSAILAFVDTSVAQVQKSATSSTARTLTAAINTIANVARVHSCCSIIAGRQVPKGGKDIFTVMHQCIETLKAASTNTPQYELLLISMKTLAALAAMESTRRKLCARKKWVEKLLTTLKAVESVGKRRGAAVDQEKTEVLKELLGVFGKA
jgi:ribosomal protein L17